MKRLGRIIKFNNYVVLIAIFITFYLTLYTRHLQLQLKKLESRLESNQLPAPPVDDVNGVESQLLSVNLIMQQLTGVGQVMDDTAALNNTKKAKREFLVFNRVPKVGSQFLMDLLYRLSLIHNFTCYLEERKVPNEQVKLTPPKQLELAKIINNISSPGTFSRHVAFINFTEFNLPDPIYVNMVRDPVERVISWYYYVRTPWWYLERRQKFPDLPFPDIMWLKKDYETCVRTHDPECQYIQGAMMEPAKDHRRQSLFFCGHEDECRPFNSAVAVEKAKRVVDEHYAVVGILEDINTTLTVFEHYIPKFFKGAMNIYYSGEEQLTKINKNIYKPPVSAEIKEIVRRNFTREIEFYQFCKQRLYKQYVALKSSNQL